MSWRHSIACAIHDGNPCSCKDVIRQAIGPYTLPARTAEDELRHRAHAALDELERSLGVLDDDDGGLYGDWRDDPGNYGE